MDAKQLAAQYGGKPVEEDPATLAAQFGGKPVQEDPAALAAQFGGKPVATQVPVEPILSPEEQMMAPIGATDAGYGTVGFSKDIGKLATSGAVQGTFGAPEAVQAAASGAARETIFTPSEALNVLAHPELLVNRLTSSLGLPEYFEKPKEKLISESTLENQRIALDHVLTRGKIPQLRQLTEFGNTLGKSIEDTISPEMKQAMALTSPTGNLIKAIETGDFSEISMGSDPSALGLAGQAAKVFGSTLPGIITSVITKKVAPAAIFGAGQAGAEGVDTAREHIKSLSDKELSQKSEYFRNLITLGYDTKLAREMTENKAGDLAAFVQGTVGALGGAFTGNLVTGKLDKLLLANARSTLGKIVRGVSAGGVEEGIQELAEGVATDLGIDKTVVREIGVDSFANLVLGAIGGGVVGGGRAAISKTEAEVKKEIPPPSPIETPPPAGRQEIATTAAEEILKPPEVSKPPEFVKLVSRYEQLGMTRENAELLAKQDIQDATGTGDTSNRLIPGASEPSVSVPTQQGEAIPSIDRAGRTSVDGISEPTGVAGDGTTVQSGALTPAQIEDISSPESQEVQSKASTMAHTLFNPNNVRSDGRLGWDQPPKERWPLIEAFQMGSKDVRGGFSHPEDYTDAKERQAYELGRKYAASLMAGSPIDVTNEAANLTTTTIPKVVTKGKAGRPKAVLTAEEATAKAEQRKTAQGAGRDALRAVDRAAKITEEVFDPSEFESVEAAQVALGEFNEKRRQALEDAHKISIDPNQKHNKAGKTAKTILEKATFQERELAKTRYEMKKKAGETARSDQLLESTNGENNPQYNKFTNASQAIRWIAKNGNDFEKFLARRLEPFLRKVQLVIVKDINTDVPESRRGDFMGANGMYYESKKERVIYLDQEGGINNTVFLHEALHGATLARIKKYIADIADGIEPNEKLAEAVEELNAIMKRANRFYTALKSQGLTDARTDEFARVGAFTNIKEFITYGMTSPGMQEFLMQIPGMYEGQTTEATNGLFTRFVQSIRKLFNMGAEHNSSFQDLIIVTDKLLKAPLVEQTATSEAVASKKLKTDKILEKIGKSEFADDIGGGLGELIRARSWEDVKDVFKSSWETLNSKSLKGLLPVLTSMQITDWVGDKIPHLDTVNRLVERMAVMRAKMLASIAETTSPWVDFSKKYAGGARLLARLMHYTTLAEVDPTLHPTLQAALQNDTKLVELRKSLAAAAVTSKPAIKGQITTRENRLTRAYEMWDKVGKIGKGEAQTIYNKVKDHYKTTFNLHRAILDERITTSLVPGDVNDASTPKGRLMSVIRQTYENAKKTGVYFPLMRYGNFWVGIGKGKSREFYMFESEIQRNIFLKKRVKQLQKAGDKRNQKTMQEDEDLAFGNDLTKLRNNSMENSKMLQEIFKIIDTTGITDKEALKDSVYQMYLMTMPEQSFRNQFVHRKGTAGFSGDALRNFVRAGYASAGQLSRLKYGPDITNEMDSAHASLEGNPDKAKLEMILNEIGTRVGEELNPFLEDQTTHRIANGLNQAAFLYMLTSPKSAIANLTAIPIFGWPVLASRYGEIKSAAKLLSYSKVWNHTTFIKKDVNGNLSYTPLSIGMSKYVQSNPILAKAFEEAAERGVTEITRTYDLISMAKTPSLAFSNPVSRAIRAGMDMMGILFHHSERLNRETMFMATFELAYEKAVKDGLSPGTGGDAFAKGIDEAVKNTYDSMFNYTKYNRPRIMRSPTTRVMFQFKLFPQQVTAYYVRNFMGMLPFIEGNDAKRAAATQLFGSLMMTGLFAGVVGMPMYSLIVGVIQGLLGAMRDKDEPVPIEERNLDLWFRNKFLPEMFGDHMAAIIEKGPVSVLSNLDIASSTSLDNLWFRDTKFNASAANEFKDFFINFMGPSFSMGENVVKSYDDFRAGHFNEGVEKLTPAAFRGGVTQMRWGEEGILTKGQQAPIFRPEEVTKTMRFWKVFGFNPTELSRIQDTNFAIAEEVKKAQTERVEIMKRLDLDLTRTDNEHFREQIQKIIKFNRNNPELAIEIDSIMDSVENRAKLRAMANRGLSVPEKLAPRLYKFIQPSRPLSDKE